MTEATSATESARRCSERVASVCAADQSTALNTASVPAKASTYELVRRARIVVTRQPLRTYPTPRTVAINFFSCGASIFLRRWLMTTSTMFVPGSK